MSGDTLRGEGPDSRTVLVNGPLDAGAVNRVTARLMVLDDRSGRPVAVLVNSPGGSLYDVAHVLDVFDLIRCRLEVTALGRAHGTAGILVAGAPGRRLIGPRATLSLRTGPEDPQRGSVEELARHAAALRALGAQVAERLARRTGRTPAWLLDQFRDGDVFRAADAVELGLVDAAVTSMRR